MCCFCKQAQKERQESTTLKQAYDRLVADHEVLKQRLKVFKCYTCGGPTDDSSTEQQLLAENARLKQELSSLRNIPIQPPAPANPSSSAQPMILDNPGSHAPLGQSLTLEEISRYLFLASTAVNELTKLGSERRDNPYWKIDENSTRETLNYEAYKSYFSNGHIIKPPGYVMEASRETGSVYMLPSTLVNNLANVVSNNSEFPKPSKFCSYVA